MQATTSLQKLFNLLPVVWQMLHNRQEQVSLSLSQQRKTARLELGFLADAFKWGSACSRAVSQHWMLSMHKVPIDHS